MNSPEKFTAIVSECVQVGTESWRQVHVTKVFPASASMAEVLEWARGLGLKGIKVSGITFADTDE